MLDRPSWRTTLAEAFAALSPAEQEAAREHRRQRREESRARKAGKLATARQVFAMHDDGRTAAEIGAACGRSPQWVYASPPPAASSSRLARRVSGAPSG